MRLDFFRYAIKTAPGISIEESSGEKLEKTVQRLLQELAQGGVSDRKNTCISCWHCNEFESEAMWKLYSVNTTNAVAIQTTCQRLYKALGEDPYIDIGKVKYIDYRKQFSNVGMGAFWYKRKSFEHEREMRVIIRNYENTGKGISRSIDLDTLIDYKDFSEKFSKTGCTPKIGKKYKSASSIKSIHRAQDALILADGYFDYDLLGDSVKVPVVDCMNGIICSWQKDAENQNLIDAFAHTL